jgi:AcrR family transcriptional regulator
MMSRTPTPAGRGHRAPAGEGDRLRGELLEAAEARMVERGFHGMTLRQVARDVGVSATSVYLHFSSKDDLAVAVCHRRFSRLAERMAEVCADLSEPLEQIQACGRVYIEFGLANPELYQFMLGGDLTHEQVLSHLGPDEEMVGLQILQWLADLIAAGMEQGSIQPAGDPLDVANVLWATVHGVVGVIQLEGKAGTPPPERLIETTLELIHRALVADG